jgi:hypothetical protein
VKFPNPPHLSPVPQTIDPDRWVLALSGKVYKRKLDGKGTFQLGDQTYYVQQKLRGRSILVWVDGQQRELVIYADRKPMKKLLIKGLHNRTMNFPDYVDLMCKEAASTWHRLLRRTPTYR